MAIIMRNSGQKRDQGDKRKQLYTWVGCGLVAILTLIGIIPTLSGEERKPDYSQFSSRQQDLAALPFGTDAEAGSFLRNNPGYSAISNEELLGSLFSAEDRKERQAQDRAEGVPPPADPEYREIARQKEKAAEVKAIKEARIEKQKKASEVYNKEREKVINKEKDRAAKRNMNQNQSKPGSLSTSSMVGSRGGGSTGVTGSIWRYEGKDVKTGNNSMPASHALTAQDIAFAKGKGRNVGLDVAAIESLKGANAESAETAAASAIDAFQGEVKPEDLDKDQQELGFEALPEGIGDDLQDDINRSLNDELDKQDKKNNASSHTGKGYSINENCMDSNGKRVRACVWNKLLDKGMDMLMDIGKSVATSYFNGLISSKLPGKDDWVMGNNGMMYNRRTGESYTPNTNTNTNLLNGYNGLGRQNYQLGGDYHFNVDLNNPNP